MAPSLSDRCHFNVLHPRYNAAFASYPCNNLHQLSLPSQYYDMWGLAGGAKKASVGPVECAEVDAEK